MEGTRKRTSMSVPEMGRILGLCKTDTYWLIKKNYFETVLVGGSMRVKIDSFEKWYANQFWYHKVDGTPPGEELMKTTYSVSELAERIGMKEATAYALISKGHFDIVDALGKCRITKDSFERWYASQSIYRTIEDQKRDNALVESTLGLTEIARMLGVHRQNIYNLVAAGHFEVITIGRHNRVTKDSFDKWYRSQSRYRLITEARTERS